MKIPSAEFWRGRRVWLTGHTGFKGAWMVLLLRQLGAEVHGYSLPGPVSRPDLFDAARLGELCRDKRGDIRDGAAVQRALTASNPDIVLHMAAQPLVRLSFREPVETFATNVMGTVNVLHAAARQASVRTVGVVTSDKAYENREQVWAYRESDAMGGHDPYSASKGCSELVASSFARTYFAAADGARLCSLRAGNVIGGGDWAEDRLIPDLVRAVRDERPVEIRNPSSIRPWQHVLDPLTGYLLAIERVAEASTWSGFDAWNFGPNPGEELPVRDVVETFRGAWEGRPEAAYGQPRPGEHEAGLLRVDPTKAKTELGWRPSGSNLEAVSSAAAWYRDVASGADPRARTLQDIERLLNL